MDDRVLARLPLRIVSITNQREHWSSRQRRARGERLAARLATKGATLRLCLPAWITLERIAPRELDDDNLAAAMKSVRDGVADAFGVPDNHPAIRFRYAQSRGKAREYAVVIRLEAVVSDSCAPKKDAPSGAVRSNPRPTSRSRPSSATAGPGTSPVRPRGRG